MDHERAVSIRLLKSPVLRMHARHQALQTVSSSCPDRLKGAPQAVQFWVGKASVGLLSQLGYCYPGQVCDGPRARSVCQIAEKPSIAHACTTPGLADRLIFVSRQAESCT